MNLKRLRLRKALTQRELAEKSGVALATINRIETGLQKGRISTIRKLAAVLGVDPGELLEEQEEGAET